MVEIAAPEHIVCDAGVAVATGKGLTVTLYTVGVAVVQVKAFM
jgi:hypothetical protein